MDIIYNHLLTEAVKEEKVQKVQYEKKLNTDVANVLAECAGVECLKSPIPSITLVNNIEKGSEAATDIDLQLGLNWWKSSIEEFLFKINQSIIEPNINLTEEDNLRVQTFLKDYFKYKILTRDDIVASFRINTIEFYSLLDNLIKEITEEPKFKTTFNVKMGKKNKFLPIGVFSFSNSGEIALYHLDGAKEVIVEAPGYCNQKVRSR